MTEPPSPEPDPPAPDPPSDEPAYGEVDDGDVEEVYPVARKPGELTPRRRRDLQFTVTGCASLTVAVLAGLYLFWTLLQALYDA